MDSKLNSEIQKLAKSAVSNYVANRKIIKAKSNNKQLSKQGAAFVCVKIKDKISGCAGSIEPKSDNLAQEIVENTITAVFGDYRFNPIEAHELNKLDFSVNVIKKISPIRNINELDPSKFGLIIKQGLNQSVILPNQEGIETAAQQVDIAKHKTNFTDKDDFKLYKLEVTCY